MTSYRPAQYSNKRDSSFSRHLSLQSGTRRVLLLPAIYRCILELFFLEQDGVLLQSLNLRDTLLLPAIYSCNLELGETLLLPAIYSCNLELGETLSLPAIYRCNLELGKTLLLPAIYRCKLELLFQRKMASYHPVQPCSKQDSSIVFTLILLVIRQVGYMDICSKNKHM